MSDPQDSREPFRIITPHREGCKGDFEIDYPMDARTVEMTCTLRHREGKCNGRATADLPALLAENAELRAERDIAIEGMQGADELIDELEAERAEALKQANLGVLGNGLSLPSAVLALKSANRLNIKGRRDAEARVEELEAEHEDQITRICDALIEVGPWDDIDGDGDEAEVIVRHIHQLAAAESSAPDNEGSK